MFDCSIIFLFLLEENKGDSSYLQLKKEKELRKKQSKDLIFHNSLEKEQKKNVSNNASSSTLSLHIAAYENVIQTSIKHSDKNLKKSSTKVNPKF